jgi:phosphate starvation-inducible PhoH-like protein
LGKLQGKAKLFLGNNEEVREFLQNHQNLLDSLEKEFLVKIITRGNELQILGDKKEVKKARKIIKGALNGNTDYFSQIAFLKEETKDIPPDVILVTNRGKYIVARTPGQKVYVEAMKKYDITISIGPAGTGKTYLAVAMAISSLKNSQVSRIILTRPVVEAGEKLGFLPGDIQEKVNPYFRPIYDALFDMIEVEKFQSYFERGIIEIAPLAYMRGRTLNDAFIILDEAQNTTYDQMKMFLTRMGFSSKIVITGDITQIDLPQDKKSGLEEIQNFLKNIPGIKFIYLTEKDVVRHELVQKIIKAYEEYERKENKLY